MKKGFTLIELLIVVAIIGILVTVGFSSYTVFLKNARDTRRQSDLKVIQSGLERYHGDQKYYPASLGVSGVIASDFKGSLTNGAKVYMDTLPHDPDTAASYLYKAYKSDRTTDCSADATQCSRYCLYANLENTASSLNSCPAQSGYNFAVTSPD